MAEGLIAAVRSGSLPVLERMLESERCRDEINGYVDVCLGQCRFVWSTAVRWTESSELSIVIHKLKAGVLSSYNGVQGISHRHNRPSPCGLGEQAGSCRNPASSGRLPRYG